MLRTIMNAKNNHAKTIINEQSVADLRGSAGNAPPRPNSFNFMQFLGNLGKIVCWCPPGELAPPLGEILDPPTDNHAKSIMNAKNK